MPVGQQHHQSVTVAVAVGLGRLDQLLDFVNRQMFAGAKLGVWAATRSDCSNFSGWCHQSQFRFFHG
jgi:hypothetical protein